MNQSETTIEVAIIGYGLAGAVFHAPLIASVPGLRVAAIVTNNEERRAQAQRDFPDATIYPDAEALQADAHRYQLAVIATTNEAHLPLAVACMGAGMAVVIDKPMALTPAEAMTIVQTSERLGKPCTVFQNRRWDGDFLTVRELVTTGRLGSIARFESRFERYRPAPRQVWRETTPPEAGGGLLFDLGSHLIDQATQLFGVPETVYAEMPRRRPGSQIDDDTFVALHFPNGVDVHLFMSMVAPILGPRFVLRGLDGAYEKYGMDPQEDALRAGKRPGMTGWGEDIPERWGTLAIGDTPATRLTTLPGSYESFYQGVAHALRSGAPLPVDPMDAVLTLRIIMAARQSATQGQVVALNTIV